MRTGDDGRSSRAGRWGRPLAWMALALALVAAAPLLRDLVLSAALMAELLRPLRPGPVEWLTRAPQEARVTFQGRHRSMEANLYRPVGGGRRAPILLIHGVVETGKDDPRMVWLARLLARAGFVVLVPDFLGFKSLRLRVSDIGEMVDAALYLRDLEPQVLSDRIGMVGFSYGAGPMLIAATDPRLEGRVAFVVSFGGYYDLVNLIRFVTTGYYEHGQERGRVTPSDYTRWIFLRYNLDLLRDPVDQAILSRLVEAGGWVTLADDRAVLADLTPEGRSVYRLLVNRDPDRVSELISRLAPSIREMIDQLSPSRQVRRLGAYAIIVHSKPDPFIPHTESLALAEALSRTGKVRLEILQVFRHVQPDPPRLTPRTLVQVYLPEGWRIYRLILDLLRQRR